jgi:peptidyl-dipeptidase A
VRIMFASALALAIATPSLAQNAAPAAPSAAQADAFVASAEKQLADLATPTAQASWINATYITQDSDAIAARLDAEFTALQVKLATEAAKYKDVAGLSFDTARKLNLLRNSITLASPADAAQGAQLATLKAQLQSAYGKGKGTLKGQPINGSDIEEAMGTNRNPDELKEMWASWHTNVGAPMKSDYARMAMPTPARCGGRVTT